MPSVPVGFIPGAVSNPESSTNTAHDLMQAAVYERYGPPEVVKIKQVAKPIPKDNEVLVRVRATSVCAGDRRLRSADPSFIRLKFGFLRPTKIPILGMEFSGDVEEVGRSVTRFVPGQAVFGSTGFKFGAHAEYVCVPESSRIDIKPDKLSYNEAAAMLFGGVSALYFLRKANLKAGQHVLVYGASGSVGVFAVQLAKYYGAHVTGVCSTANLAIVKSLGADEVIDYTRDDFSAAGPVYDVVFDTVGYSGFSRSLTALKRGGCYVRIAGSGGSIGFLAGAFRMLCISATRKARVVGGVAKFLDGDLQLLKGLMVSGRIKTIIGRRYSLQQIVEAHRYADSGHKLGHVVIEMNEQTASSFAAPHLP